ncbi:MAG TPA: MotA/TolQ/ExbB proton channel family protein [Myxococcota bacterium]|nr:MotA/TolQ/ExbB proton channel family protein [Myxococcota bacterium]HNH48867.1 MotA/TolQ/ExbB proton channel family protein [Myxococcota bacterium]
MKRPLIGILVGLGITVVAPSCGLLGTVIGLSQSFHAVGSTAPEAKAKTLSEGISVAMNSTMVGLALVPVGMTILLVSVWFWWKGRGEEAA